MKNKERIEVLAAHIELLAERINNLERSLTPPWAFGENKYSKPEPLQKTTRQWLEELPEGYRERALSQMDEHWVHITCKSIHGAICVFAVWVNTNEGYDFWLSVRRHYEDGTPLPPLPEEPNELDPIQSEILEAKLAFHLDDVVRFQAEHEIQVQRGSDLMYWCYIDRAVYATSITFIHALVVGISIYQKRHE